MRESSWWRLVAVLAVACAVALAACGDDDTDSGSSQGSASGSSDAGGDSEAVAEATRITEAGVDGSLYYGGDEGQVDPSAVEALGPGEWRGPTSAPTPEAGKTIKVISCIAGSACEDIGNGAVEAGKLLGWNIDLVNADATPVGYNKAVAAALAQKPDGIITVAIPAGQVADKVAQAKAEDVKWVGVATIAEEGAKDNYDVNQSYLETFSAQLEAYRAIADSNGTAKVLLMWDYSQPHLVQSGTAIQTVLEQCDGCEVLQVYKADTATFADPAALQQAVTSLVQRHGENLEYIVTPYGLGSQVIVEATRAAGRNDIKVLTKNAEVANLGSVAEGGLFGDSGTDPAWAGFAAVDQMNRLLAGEEPLETWEEGLQAKVFNEDNAPADGVFDWSAVIDFKGEYAKAWGVD